MAQSWNESQLPQLIREIVASEIDVGKGAPDDETDLVRTGLLDSMGWVAVLTGIEELSQIANFGNPWPENRPQSIRALVAAATETIGAGEVRTHAEGQEKIEAHRQGPVAVAGWGYTVGSLEMGAGEMEKECGLSPGTLSSGAGIESMRRASEQEDQVSLGQRAAEAALEGAGIEADDVDLLVTTSATFLSVPSFGAALHSRLLLSESCAVLDVGGACVGLLNALRVASSILATGGRGVALVVASEVHSRVLASLRAPDEFRGLFGDGASAFVLKAKQPGGQKFPTIGSFTFGCSGRPASALEAKFTDKTDFEFQFKGEQLGRAAVERLARIVEQLERLSGRPRSEVAAFAIHEPNPRLVEIFAQNSHVPLDKIPLVSRAYGNLGSATCGVSLCAALNALANTPAAGRALIFVAAVGPGLLWGGTYLD